MSTSQAIVAGWMESPTSAVNDEARRRAEDNALAAMVDQYAALCIALPIPYFAIKQTQKMPCRRRLCASCATGIRWARCAIIACG